MDIQHHVYVPEVVREPKMHFYRVPRLGAFLAVPLVYKSCLYPKSLDKSIVDYQNYKQSVEELERAKKEWEEDNEKLKEEREKAGEVHYPEERTWPVLKEKAFLTKQRKFVVSMDTLGQDREFTFDQRKFAIETIVNFANIWERREAENLTKDRNLRLHMADIDKEYTDTVAAKLTEEEEEHLKEHIHQISTPPPTLQQDDSQSDLNGAANNSQEVSAPEHPYLKMDEEERDIY